MNIDDATWIILYKLLTYFRIFFQLENVLHVHFIIMHLANTICLSVLSDLFFLSMTFNTYNS